MNTVRFVSLAAVLGAALATNAAPQAAPPASRPAPILLDDGHVEIPFKATLADQDVDTVCRILLTNTLTVSTPGLRAAIREQLQANRPAIERQDPQYFKNLDRHVADLTIAAQAAADALRGPFQDKIGAELRRVAARLRADLERDNPALVLRAAYRYAQGRRNPAKPGWDLRPAVESHGQVWLESGLVTFEQKLDLSAPGATITVPVRAHAGLSMSTSYFAFSSYARDLSMPVTEAGAVPAIRIKTALDISGTDQVVLNTGLSTTGNFDLPRVHGTMTAHTAASQPTAIRPGANPWPIAISSPSSPPRSPLPHELI